jgi:uncharacterized protein (TIGR00255 family)
MTGFGRAEAAANGTIWAVECSSVNRKLLEVSVSLPREIADLEAQVRALVPQFASRGRVSISIRTSNAQQDDAPQVHIHEEVAEQYVKRLRGLATKLGLSGEISIQDLLRCPGVLGHEKPLAPAANLWPTVEPAVRQALSQLVEMRLQEGSHLRTDIGGRMATLQQLLDQVAARAPSIPEAHRKALLQRLADAGLDLDVSDDRVLREVALFADRCDISEEITRVRSHLQQFTKLMGSPESQGRALDFLMQEFGREWTTMSNKAHNAELSQIIVQAKAELEKAREQVQNVE